MRIVTVKLIEIFTDGTTVFSYKTLNSLKQVVFHEKDSKNFLFYKKPTKKQSFYILPRNSYKLKYKF